MFKANAKGLYLQEYDTVKPVYNENPPLTNQFSENLPEYKKYTFIMNL